MEKLQAAIEKARSQRAAEAAAAPPAPAARADIEAEPAPSRPEGARDWTQLPEIKISESRAIRNRLFLKPKSSEAAYFDKLRTKILQRCRDNGWTRMVITSANKSCGKTTIATNLAASFARQTDRKMILLDLDMRRPGVARQFGCTGNRSVADVLEGRVDFQDAAMRLGENVAVGMSYELHPNPAQLLLQDRTAGILDEIQRDWAPDLIVFDTPPILATDDTMALLKHVDCALIVAAAEQTTTDEVDTVEKEIAEVTNVMGVVLNKCHYSEPGRGYYNY